MSANRQALPEGPRAAGVSADEFALVATGIFLGGALDHILLALAGSRRTPYGLRAGVAGNWLLAAVDAGLALWFYRRHRRLEGKDSGYR